MRQGSCFRTIPPPTRVSCAPRRMALGSKLDIVGVHGAGRRRRWAFVHEFDLDGDADMRDSSQL
jgi:hypothetical protein